MYFYIWFIKKINAQGNILNRKSTKDCGIESFLNNKLSKKSIEESLDLFFPLFLWEFMVLVEGCLKFNNAGPEVFLFLTFPYFLKFIPLLFIHRLSLLSRNCLVFRGVFYYCHYILRVDLHEGISRHCFACGAAHTGKTRDKRLNDSTFLVFFHSYFLQNVLRKGDVLWVRIVELQRGKLKRVKHKRRIDSHQSEFGNIDVEIECGLLLFRRHFYRRFLFSKFLFYNSEF